MPSLTPVKIYKGEPTQIILESASAINALAAVHTVPAGKRLILKYIRVTNLDASITNYVNVKAGTSPTASAGDYILRRAEVQPYDVVIFEMNEVIEAGDKIYIWQDVGSVSVQISGVEVTL